MEENLKLYVISTYPLCSILREILEYKNINFQIINVEELDEEDRKSLFKEVKSEYWDFH